MKNTIIVVLLIAAATLGALSVVQRNKLHRSDEQLARTEARLVAVENQLKEKSEAIAKAALTEQKAKALQDVLRETSAAAIEKSKQVEQLQQSAAAAKTNGIGHLLANMLKDPKIKEMIKSQQKTALSGMIDKNYGRLFSDLHLTPEQSSALTDIILNKQLEAADMGMSMFSDDLDATKRAELVQQVKEASGAADAQIKELLGADNFAQFQEYEKSIGERMTVSGFKDQLGSGPTVLTGDQEQQLVEAMTQERQNFKFTTDFSDQSKFTGDFASVFTEDKMNVFFQELAQLNQQYLARAQGILSPDQFTAFEKYLNNQQALQKAGLQMAVKIFAPSKPGGN
jgi:hypothetical protein